MKASREAEERKCYSLLFDSSEGGVDDRELIEDRSGKYPLQEKQDRLQRLWEPQTLERRFG